MAVAGSGGLRMDSGVLGCGGEIIHHKVEQMVGSNVAQPGGKEHGKDLVVFDGLMQCGDQMFFGDSAFIEKFLHQLVFALGNNFH